MALSKGLKTTTKYNQLNYNTTQLLNYIIDQLLHKIDVDVLCFTGRSALCLLRTNFLSSYGWNAGKIIYTE